MKNSVKLFLSSGKKSAVAAKKLLEQKREDEDYLGSVISNNIWTNSFETSVPVRRIYDHVHSFLDVCDISDGKATFGGRTRKVLFLGFDGMRADTAARILCGKNEFDLNLGSLNARYSGINRLRRLGGLYLGYCGGEVGKSSEQTTSTSANWTSQFTGVWGDESGIFTNEDTKNMAHKTFILEYALKGFHTSLNFDWDYYFDVNLRPEVEYALANPGLPIIFCDTDRKKGGKLPKKPAMTREFYDYLAPERPSPSSPFDTGVRDYVLHRINMGDSVICGIYHSIDSMGHCYQFSPDCAEYLNAAMSCDMFTYQILDEIERRENELNEEWLVVLANDHGGKGRGHGAHSLEERTTWIATNVKIDEKLFGRGYDGQRENK